VLLTLPLQPRASVKGLVSLLVQAISDSRRLQWIVRWLTFVITGIYVTPRLSLVAEALDGSRDGASLRQPLSRNRKKSLASEK
jgi:hypothetical protein